MGSRWLDKLLDGSPGRWAILVVGIGLLPAGAIGVRQFLRFSKLMARPEIPEASSGPVGPLLPALVMFGIAWLPFVLIGLMLGAVHVLTRKKGAFSAPLQSATVRDICEHLTEEEKASLRRMGALSFVFGAVTFMAPIAYAWRYPSVLSVSVAGALFPVFVGGLFVCRNNMREYLASTEYAEKEGIDASDIPFFPWEADTGDHK
jgi:hypothetical protein